MRSSRIFTAAVIAGAGLGATLLGGCVKKIEGTYQPNLPPTVRLTQAPLNDGSAYFYAYRLNWIGYDPDGRVEYFEYAIDPPFDGSPIPWERTTNNEQILFFTASVPDSSAPLDRAIDFHNFAIRAIDDDGDSSAIITRSFWSFTVAPTVNITNPRPSNLVTPLLTPSVRLSWDGADIDGQFTTKPVRYRYTLLAAGSDFPLDLAISNPDSLRRFYAPDFEGWQETGGDTTEAQYTNLTPGASYLFVVVGFDEAGAYSPIFSLNKNMLRFRVGFAGTLGPVISMFNEFFFYKYATGGYVVDPQREVFIEVAAGVPSDPATGFVTFNWFADPPAGSDISNYRWALDIEDVSDNTPREDEQTDLARWSTPSLLTQKATVGPFYESGEHRFYVEASDNNGQRSLGIVRFQVVQATFDKPLRIIDDTRFKGDEFINGAFRPPIGEWPTAAELDTFLYAVGGVPWKAYPSGTMSTPGLFAGYAYDTLGTPRGVSEVVVRLAQIAQYEHVIWMVDASSASYNSPGTDGATPITALRYMSSPGRFNTLAAYAKQGGKVWLLGGGGAYATLKPWDNTNNNTQGFTVFSNAQGELIPGRLMYDLAAWRSEIRSVATRLNIRKNLGRFEFPGVSYPPNDPGNPQPTFSTLPNISTKSTLTDPFPPGRPGQSPSVFYKNAFDAEFLSLQNFVLEDLDPDPDVLDEQSVLDTLYWVRSSSLPGTTALRVAMTYYHGPFSQRLVFSGFNIWDWPRTDCQALVDWVLQEIWGMQKMPVIVQPPAAVLPAGQAVPAGTLVPGSAGGLERFPPRGALSPNRKPGIPGGRR